MRFARMWNSKSPGVETAWRLPARISRNECSSAGRGSPKSRSHALDPKPMTQERPPSRSRNSTARNSAARSPQNDRRIARLSEPGFIVRQEDRGASEWRSYRLRDGTQATRHFRRGHRTGLHRMVPGRLHGISRFKEPRSPRMLTFGPRPYHHLLTNVHAASARAVCRKPLHRIGSTVCHTIENWPQQRSRRADDFVPRQHHRGPESSVHSG